MAADVPSFGTRRSGFEAWALDAMAGSIHASHGQFKAQAIGSMAGTVVEVGAGTGANMRYYAPGTRVVAVEPNPVMHSRLREKARDHDIDLDIRTLVGEQMDLDDDEADHAVGTLLLCGVQDPAQVVAEIQRVVKPGGRYAFLEHVVAEDRGLRVLQAIARPAQRWIANGCDVMRDTGGLLADAGFADLDMETVDEGWKGLHTRIMVRGTATIA